jgi:hypothetical protein
LLEKFPASKIRAKKLLKRFFGFGMISPAKLVVGLVSAESSRNCAPQQYRPPAEFSLELSD